MDPTHITQTAERWGYAAYQVAWYLLPYVLALLAYVKTHKNKQALDQRKIERDAQVADLQTKHTVNAAGLQALQSEVGQALGAVQQIQADAMQVRADLGPPLKKDSSKDSSAGAAPPPAALSALTEGLAALLPLVTSHANEAALNMAGAIHTAQDKTAQALSANTQALAANTEVAALGATLGMNRQALLDGHAALDKITSDAPPMTAPAADLDPKRLDIAQAAATAAEQSSDAQPGLLAKVAPAVTGLLPGGSKDAGGSPDGTAPGEIPLTEADAARAQALTSQGV